MNRQRHRSLWILRKIFSPANRKRRRNLKLRAVQIFNFLMSDFDTTFQQIRELLKEFQQQRDWEQFHDPKNLAEAISIEASELMEHFLWKDKEKV